MAKNRGGATKATTGKNRGATKTPNRSINKISAKKTKNMPKQKLAGEAGGQGTLSMGNYYNLVRKSAFGELTKTEAQGGGAMPKGQS